MIHIAILCKPLGKMVHQAVFSTWFEYLHAHNLTWLFHDSTVPWFRWLYEIQCQSNSRFNSKPVEEMLDRHWEFSFPGLKVILLYVVVILQSSMLLLYNSFHENVYLPIIARLGHSFLVFCTYVQNECVLVDHHHM